MGPTPTLAGFQAFITSVMAIKPVDLPANSPTIPLAFAVALSLVNPALRATPILGTDGAGVTLAVPTGIQTFFDLAVYNLAGSNLLNYAQDQPGRTYFARLRKKLNINGFVSGVVQSSGDESTNVSLVVQEAAKNFTLANLQQLKDPYGRRYLEIAQSYGPTIWGMS